VKVPIDFHGVDKKNKNIMKVNGNQNCFLTNIIQNIFFCIL